MRGASALEPADSSPLADPAVAQVDVAALAAEITTLSAVLARLGGRLAALAVERQREEDHLLSADEAAAVLGVGRDWLKRRALPFAVRLGPGAIRYSSRGLQKWILRRTGAR